MQTPYRDCDAQPALDACSGSPLQKIIQKARYLRTLDHLVQNLLPVDLTGHCRVMNVNMGKLILGVDDASMATQLRFFSAELLKKIRKDKRFFGIAEIKCRIFSEPED